MEIDFVPIDDLVGWDGNPKDHDIGGLIESFRRFGYTLPIITDGNRIVAGHGRVEALAAMRDAGEDPPDRIGFGDDGRWLIPRLVGVEFASEAEAEAYLVADNRWVELGGWDVVELTDTLARIAATSSLDAVGYSDDDLALMIADLEAPLKFEPVPDDESPRMDQRAERPCHTDECPHVSE